MPACSARGCTHSAYAQGLCDMHYMRGRRS
jgi:hypothetical protein